MWICCRHDPTHAYHQSRRGYQSAKKHQRHDQHFQRVDEHLADHAKEAADDVVIDERDIHQVQNNAYNDAKADGQRIFIVNDILPSPGCVEV